MRYDVHIIISVSRFPFFALCRCVYWKIRHNLSKQGQVLNLDRPWRERRDMLSGILSAASVNDRRRVVETLDQRFEEHAEIDDFEIVARWREFVGRFFTKAYETG